MGSSPTKRRNQRTYSSKPALRIYVIRKYIKANSAQDAIIKDRKHKVDDVWLEEESKRQLLPAIGFVREDDI